MIEENKPGGKGAGETENDPFFKRMGNFQQRYQFGHRTLAKAL
jgi:hypothetical protein